MNEDKREAMYEANQKKLDDAGDRGMYYCPTCVGCKYYEAVGPIFLDVIGGRTERGICHHSELQDKDNCKGREELT